MQDIVDYATYLGVPVGFTEDTIVCLFPYYIGVRPNANLSVYCYAVDYHIIVNDYLERIAKFVQETYNAHCTTAVDIGKQKDIQLAVAAGLGYVGRNQLLINPTYGSYCFIGSVKTNLQFTPSDRIASECLGCGRCQDSCPGGALNDGFNSFKRCASYITQKKGELSLDEIEILKKGGLVFGCDTCQQVCPHNRFVPITHLREFHESIIATYSPNQSYENRAFTWRGEGILKRNFKILQCMNDANS